LGVYTINEIQLLKVKIFYLKSKVYIMDNKTVILIPPTEKNKRVKLEKTKKKRNITQHSCWKNAVEELNKITSQNIDAILQNDESTLQKIILQQLKYKIGGYMNQDKLKKKLCLEKFVTLQVVIELLKTSDRKCYYCKEETELLYENVREPKQWTLERLNNDFGHNSDNVVISCLSCNLRRRTMASERYIQTKAMAKIVKLD